MPEARVLTKTQTEKPESLAQTVPTIIPTDAEPYSDVKKKHGQRFRELKRHSRNLWPRLFGQQSTRVTYYFDSIRLKGCVNCWAKCAIRITYVYFRGINNPARSNEGSGSSSDARWHIQSLTYPPIQQRPNDKKFSCFNLLSFCQRQTGITTVMSLGQRSNLRSGS